MSNFVKRGAMLLCCALQACAGSASLPVPMPTKDGPDAFSSRLASIVSSWEAAGGSRIRRPTTGEGRVPREAAVSAAWWGFDARDATTALQAAIDSGAPVVVVPMMSSPWVISRTVNLGRGAVELLLEPGVVVAAAEGEFRGGGDSLIEAVRATDFAIVGYGAVLRMRKADYQRPPYEKAEWRHAIMLRGVSRARIVGLQIESSGGDGIYVGTSRHAPCEDLVLRDLGITESLRQGVSVISARHLLIENCHIAGSSGAQPMSGIDFEPNSGDPGFTDCVVRACRIEHNAGVGLLIVLSKLGPESAPVSIAVEDCIIDNFPIAVWLRGLDSGVRGTLTISGTSIWGWKLLRGSSVFAVSSLRAP